MGRGGQQARRPWPGSLMARTRARWTPLTAEIQGFNSNSSTPNREANVSCGGWAGGCWTCALHAPWGRGHGMPSPPAGLVRLAQQGSPWSGSRARDRPSSPAAPHCGPSHPAAG